MKSVVFLFVCGITTCSLLQAFNIYSGEKYIELVVNDTFALVCSPQNASDLPIDSNGSTEERLCANEDSAELVLNFKAVKQSDTGTYSCITANGTLLSSVYVFVMNPDPDSQVFITQTKTELTSNGTHLIVPCRTNRMVSDDQVRLHVQREWLQGVPYDPRKGFTVSLDRLQNLKLTTFRCTYRQHISQLFTYAGSPRNKRPMISAKEWAVIEDKVTAECVIKVDDPSQYNFEWIPPEEENATAEGHVVPQEGIIWTQIIIPNSNKNDEGNYTCTLINNATGENITSSTMYVHIGFRIGQVRLYKAGYEQLDVDRGLIQFTSFADVFGEEHEYWRNWTKFLNESKYNLTPEEEAGISFGLENGVHKEQISINMSAVENYSAFGLEIHVPFFVLVVVKNNSMAMSLRVYQNGHESEGPVDPLSNVTVMCLTLTALHGTEPEMLLRRYGQDSWKTMNTTRISPNYVAFTVQIQNDAYIACDNGFRKITRHITVLPWMEAKLHITPSPTKIIDDKEIHEADVVTLNCTALTAQIKELEWYNEESLKLKNKTVLDSDEEFTALAIVKKIARNDAGVYRCVATLLDGSTIVDSVRVTVVGAINHRTAKCTTPVSFAWLKDNKQVLCSKNEFSGIETDRIEKAGFQCFYSGGIWTSEQDSTILFYPFIALAVIGVLLVISLISTILYARGRNTELQRLRKLHSMLIKQEDIALINRALPLHEQVERLPYDGNYEINLERLVVTKVLSSGHYGRVYLGKLHARTGTETMDVAVKGPKDAAKYDHMKALVDELRIMIAIGTHPNVLCLIGAVTENIRKGDDVYVIMELCEEDLKSYLLRNRENLLRQYSKNEDEGEPEDYYLIPANNMLTFEENNKHKFSSSSSGYISLNKTTGERVKAAIDLISFAYQIANGMEYLAAKMSDIWSYGILLWEIFSFGEEPYKNFDSIEKLIEFHKSGGRLEKPRYVPDEIAELMSQCWQIKPEERPNFSTCRETTEEIFKSSSAELYESLQNQLTNELNEMKRYPEWRDGRKRVSSVKTGSRFIRYKSGKDSVL